MTMTQSVSLQSNKAPPHMHRGVALHTSHPVQHFEEREGVCAVQH